MGRRAGTTRDEAGLAARPRHDTPAGPMGAHRGDEERAVLAARARRDEQEALIAGLQRRDEAAAERLVTMYGRRVYRLAVRVTGNRADAEEVTQDALLTVVRKIALFRGASALSSWLYRITANAAYQKLRTRRRRRDGPADVPPRAGAVDPSAIDPARAVDDPVAGRELRDAIQAAVEALPALYRDVVVLHAFEGCSKREIARALGISVAAVRSRMHRSRLALRSRLAEHLSLAG
jgi:RNA polymerase sigma-70 factor (ECF subfamily)